MEEKMPDGDVSYIALKKDGQEIKSENRQRLDHTGG